MSSKTIYLKDYQKPNVTVLTTYLAIDLFDEYAVVNSKLRLQREQAGALCLYGDDLELIEITLDGTPLPADAWRLEEGNLIVDDCPQQCELAIGTRIYPQNNSQLSGLYRSHALFCTQCEAEGFRRITFYPDRPDVLSTFTTRISADKSQYPVLLSNGNLLAQGEEEDNRHWALWHDPFKKPSYLFALVAGDLRAIDDSYITSSGRKVQLRIFVEPGNEDKCAHAMQSLKNAMQWDEQVYGLEYDLDIFMIVAVSDFNMGAMENKGLNIFNTQYILARPDTATDQDFAAVEGVVAHEYFHNWTGNRVTCRDWFQLSLKEGLTVFRDQEFSRDMQSRDVNRIQDVRMLRASQFPEDAGSMAHPVRPESYEEINNFYTATVYNKGAEIIRMQQTLLGTAGFRRGMDLYFQRHDGQAVTIDDFVAAMEDANQIDLGQFKRWYTQAGTPQVRVESEYADGTLSLRLTQSCRPTPECQEKQPFHIPIRFALFDQSGARIALDQEILELKDTQASFQFSQLPGEPVVSLLRDFSAPVQLDWQPGNAQLLALLRMETDGFAKWDAAQRLFFAAMRPCYDAPQGVWHIPPELLEAFALIMLDERLAPALRACLLVIPGFEEMANLLPVVDVDVLERVREFSRAQLAGHVYRQALPLYEQLWQQEDHAIHGRAFGRRQLRNTCLSLLMCAEEAESLALCQRQFQQAKTMTDQLSAFRLLANAKATDAGQEAIARFEKQWRQDALVMDKWFSVQAGADQPDSLQRVQALMSHPAFSLKNPNKVRALLGAFCSANPKHFHALDGSGYAFLQDILLELDPLNSQIAARLASPLTRWQRYDPLRQAKIQGVLQTLSRHTLSNDLAEIVHKSLAQP
ncbi:MAG: aminopeptidase N [Legionellaceae bacterium]|nr:aminopeptidase N [Legionellaceae bacterium]